MAIYSEKIADNDRKIEQLSKNIKRDTEKRKKLMEENARLSYQAICEQYNCTGQDLLDILSREHQQAEMLQTSGLSDADIAELAGSGRSSEDSDDIAFYRRPHTVEAESRPPRGRGRLRASFHGLFRHREDPFP